MDAFLVDTEVNEAHSELAVLVNSLINTPVNQQSAQLVDGLSFDLKEDIGRRFAGLKNDLKTAREAGEELEEEITTLQRNIARLEATGNRLQAEHVKHHQDLLNELPIAIATGGDRVVERLEATSTRHQAELEKRHKDLLSELPLAIATGGNRVIELLGKGVRLQHQQTCASLKSLDSRLSELQTSQLQAVKQVQHTVSMLTEQLIQMQMKQTDEFQKAVGRFAWVIGCVAVSVLMAAGILFRVLTVHGAA